MKLPLRYKFAWRTVKYHWCMSLALIAAVAIVTGVLVGALLVGDSTRASLRELVQVRLGNIHSCLQTSTFFRQELASEIQTAQIEHIRNKVHNEKDNISTDNNSISKESDSTIVVPVIQLHGALFTEHDNVQGKEKKKRSSCINIWGVDDHFFSLNKIENANGIKCLCSDGEQQWTKTPMPNHAVINQETADYYQLKPGDSITLKMSKPYNISPESSLGNREKLLQSVRLTITGITENNTLASISLRPDQRAPRNVFVNLSWLQEELGQTERVNTLLTNTPITCDYRPVLDDYGFQLLPSVLGYWDVSSKRMVLSSQETEALKKQIKVIFPERKFEVYENLIALITDFRVKKRIKSSVTNTNDPSNLENKNTNEHSINSTNSINRRDHISRESIPYSFLAASNDIQIPKLRTGEIAVNYWTANQLDLHVGDTVETDYFEPDSLDGQPVSRTRQWTVAALLPDEPLFSDPMWVPTIPGLTDSETMSTWEAPFPFDPNRIQPADEQYWKDYRAAPKFYISLSEGRRFFPSRFGLTTSVRFRNVPTPRSSEIAPKPEDMGWTFLPIRTLSTASAVGAVSFETLFLGLGSFVLIAALILINLTYRMVIDSRSQQIGILQSAGWLPSAVRTTFVYEVLIISVLGTLAGCVLGIGFAFAIIQYMHTFWLGAIGVPFIHLTIAYSSLIIGAGGGLSGSLLVFLITLAGLNRVRTIDRLKGRTGQPSNIRYTIRGLKVFRCSIVLYIFSFIVLFIYSIFSGVLFSSNSPSVDLSNSVLNVFWGSLGLLFLGMIVYRSSITGMPELGLFYDLRNHVRTPLRSTVCMSLISIAVFLTVAMGSFRQKTQQYEQVLLSNSGNYRLFVKTALPVYFDLNSDTEQVNMGFTSEEQQLFDEVKIANILVREGDNASCSNLFRPQCPLILGVPLDFIDNPDFSWTQKLVNTNPWEALWRKEFSQPLLLQTELPKDLNPEEQQAYLAKLQRAVPPKILPVVSDHNTLDYIFQRPGLNSILALDQRPGRNVQGRVVGILANGVFQGELIASTSTLREFFPELQGYTLFLVQCPRERLDEVSEVLNNQLRDYGVEIETTTDRAARLFTIQNTYLYAFENMGCLGILLGLTGLATVLFRSLLERRKELVLMSAIGFSEERIQQIITREHMLPVITGVINGVLAALITAVAAAGFAIPGCSIIDKLLGMPWLELLLVSCICVFISWLSCRLVLTSIRPRPGLKPSIALRGNQNGL